MKKMTGMGIKGGSPKRSLPKKLTGLPIKSGKAKPQGRGKEGATPFK